MPAWTERFAELLSSRLEPGSARAGLGPDHNNRILDLARIVAHATERKNAPLATFIAGRYSALREQQGADSATAIAEAAEVARRLLPDDSLKES